MSENLPSSPGSAISPIGQADVEMLTHLADGMGFGRTHDMLRRVIAACPYLSAAAQEAAPRGEEDPYITDLKFANEQNINAARKYKSRLEFMEAKHGVIVWDADVPVQPTQGGDQGEAVKPLPGELALIQIAMKTLRHIASYSPVSRIQPVMIARDAIKEIDALTFTSEPAALFAAPQPAGNAYGSLSREESQTVLEILDEIGIDRKIGADHRFSDEWWAVIERCLKSASSVPSTQQNSAED